MLIYIDETYKCYTEQKEGLTPIESSFFDNKCKEFIEIYRYVPEGATWTREDGQKFTGEMVTPYTDPTSAFAIQQTYDKIYNDAANYVAAYEAGVESVWI